jgi:hypothetical protein
MNRNALYAIICLLVVACGFMGYLWHVERQKTNRVEIDIGKNGLSIEKK